MPISLYNSLSRRIEPFSPLDPNRVTVYLCGPTVYNFVHIGNARGPVVFDVLVKLLRRHYPQVVYARNITDVDDKINAAALEQGVPIGQITSRFTQAYREDMAELGIAPPDVEPHATAHIGQIIEMIQRLIHGGHAYEAKGHVLFNVASYASYGELSGRDTDELIAGARVEVAPYKKNPADFVLWKPSTPELPGWDSPWGRGRPGWHIECSAMSAAHLGETIDIHAGGVDLLFPHHENEIAQSTCAHGGKVFARWWLHNGMLTFGGTKMSKSLGNIEKVHDLLKHHPAEALRYALLSAHYRQPLDWSDALVEQSVRTLDRLYGTLRDMADVEAQANDEHIPASITEALAEDLGTPRALAELSAYADSASVLNHQRTWIARHLEIAQKYDSLTRADALANVGLLVKERAITQAHRELFEAKISRLEAPQIAQELRACLMAWQPAQSDLAYVKSRLLSGGLALGLLQMEPEAWFKHAGGSVVDAERVEALLEDRRAARAARDFARADAIRNELSDMGVVIEDGAQGTRWSVVKR
ncbi:cysteine--tRNA ligase [Dyella monticola]|uniref:cysteine--tRNA ligase n=1 Tax=Dyella monticola TaxID=1927958 RepID=UPI001E50B264|nr:cysteine--tRNA ligase [Dyella monticola]